MPATATDSFRRNLAQIGLLLYEQPNGYQFSAKGFLLIFVGNLFKYLRYQVESAEQQPADGHLKDFDAVKIYIKRRCTEKISIEKLCHDLAMSPATLYRVLKEAGVESYKTLVNYYRVEYTKDLLRNTNSPIKYIASVSGFDSDSSFYRVFKELTAISPNQYRERPQANDIPIGVQGYVSYSMPQAISLLREFCTGAGS